MDDAQLRTYLGSLRDELNVNGFYACILTRGNQMIIKKNSGQREYIVCQLLNNKSLILIKEVCRINLTYLSTGTHIVIAEPHYDNLVRIVELYYECGGGENPNNPMLQQLIDTRSNRIKSARKI